VGNHHRGRSVSIGHKYLLLKKALVVSGIILAVVVVGYTGLLSWDFLQEKWQDHKTQQTQAKSDIFDQAAALDQQRLPFAPKVGDPLPYKVGETLSIGKGSIPEIIFIPKPPPPPTPPPDGGEWLPVVSGSEFTFRRLGSKEYLKAICYNENTHATSALLSFGNSDSCATGEILMEEVR
jgi:hypothetical protein